MTDQQTYTDADGDQLTLVQLYRHISEGHLSVMAHGRTTAATVHITSNQLLAMIDAADPDAMRAYLRETTDTTGAEIEAESAWHGDPAEGGVTAAAIEQETHPRDLAARVMEARMLVETADQHLRGLDGALDASQMISDASDVLRVVLADLVPEADGPEDVDEPAEGPAETRAQMLASVATLYPDASPSEHLVVADWIIGTDEPDEQIEDRNMAGEVIGR